MASGDPPKRGKGRPLGSFDKSRDYQALVARMRSLVAGGALPRAAAATVEKETGIPLSTLRRHLDKKAPVPPPRRPGPIDLADLCEILPVVPEPVPTEEELERRREKDQQYLERLQEETARRQRELFSLHPWGSTPRRRK